VLAGLLALSSLAAQADIKLTGADGQSLTLAAPAIRVVSLAPDLAELLFDVDAGNVLLGTVAYSDYPAAAKNVPRIGDAFHVDVERLLALKPQLVLAWAGGTPQALIDRLRTLQLPVLVIGTHQLADVAGNIELLGLATGHSPRAQQLAADYRKDLAALQSRYAKGTPLRVFYEIQAEPLFTVGGGQNISRLIELCGGRNIFADLGELAPAVSMEAVLARDPEVIVTGGDADSERRMKLWQRWTQLSAVRYANLFSVPDDLISRATPRVLDGGRQLCDDLSEARGRLTATR
jgi:iron complex transport system substrate-binding protein